MIITSRYSPGSPCIALFTERDIHPLIGRADGRHHPSGTGTDDKDIRFEFLY
jgi:hypothetical protein